MEDKIESKIAKQFDDNFSKLVILFKGEKVFKKTKLPKNDISEIVNTLIAEKKQNTINEFKTKAVAIFESKIRFDKEMRAAKEAYEKVANDKMEQFNKEINDLFSLVENIGQVEKDYYTILENKIDESKSGNLENKV